MGASAVRCYQRHELDRDSDRRAAVAGGVYLGVHDASGTKSPTINDDRHALDEVVADAAAMRVTALRKPSSDETRP